MSSEINRPTLGGVTIPHPGRGSKVEPVWVQSMHTTLGGKTRQEVMARKYRYVLFYGVMSKAIYDALEAVVNGLVAVTFVYDKYLQSASPGVSVLAELSARELVAGAGNDEFWSSVTLTLTEVSSRI